MKLFLTALAAVIMVGVSSAQAREVLCREIPLVEVSEHEELAAEFGKIAGLAARWTTATPIPEPCQKPLSGLQALYDATWRYRIHFVTERLPLCDAGTGLPTRIVDAVNDPVSGVIQVWHQAWRDGLEHEKWLITTHELAGVAGQLNEPWTTSICWMFVPLLPGVRTTPVAEFPVMPRGPVLLAGGGGGGSTGGRGGGDVKMAGFKFRALMVLLDRMNVLKACGMADVDFETAFAGWLSREIHDPEAWKASDAEILVQTLELARGKRATEQERACLQ